MFEELPVSIDNSLDFCILMAVDSVSVVQPRARICEDQTEGDSAYTELTQSMFAYAELTHSDQYLKKSSFAAKKIKYMLGQLAPYLNI